MPVSPEKKLPKYQLLARELKAQVQDGTLKPGDQLPTFAQMRSEHGLGQATLERVYDLLEEQGFITRTPGKGIFVTEPKAHAGVGVLGFITCAISEQHPYYAHLLQGVRQEVREAGYELLLMHDKASIKWEKVDGVLVCSAYANETLRRLPPGMPRISLLHTTGDAPSVAADDYGSIRDAVQHLLGLNHRRIAYLTTANMHSNGSIERQRFQGYRDALRDASISPDPEWLRPLRAPFEPMRKWELMGYDKMKQWLQNGWEETCCTAILAHNDETAIGIIDALQEAGLKVPRDVSVVGFDGTEIADFYRPRLTTVAVPLHEIGATGARFLLDIVTRPLYENDAPTALSTLLPSALKIGESTASISL